MGRKTCWTLGVFSRLLRDPGDVLHHVCETSYPSMPPKQKGACINPDTAEPVPNNPNHCPWRSVMRPFALESVPEPTFSNRGPLESGLCCAWSGMLYFHG